LKSAKPYWSFSALPTPPGTDMPMAGVAALISAR